METELKDFAEHIKKGVVKVINEDVLIIENYPMGFKKCQMTFKKTQIRTGQSIYRTSLFNGKTSKPKKLTASRLNIFAYDEELKRHFIIEVTNIDFRITTTAFKSANGVFKEHSYSYVEKEYQSHPDNKKRAEGYKILLDFFKPYMGITEEIYKKAVELNGGL